MRKSMWGLLVCCSIICVNWSAAVWAKPPHVLLILVDDLGFGDPACFNPDSKIATPHIDRLAREGMRFTDAHAAGVVCHPSRYGLITGQYPFRADVGAWPKRPVIESGQTTLASLLQSQGYATAMVGKWHLGFDERGYDQELRGGPADRGFENFFGFRASTDIPPYFYIRNHRAEAPPTDHIAAHNSPDWTKIQGEFWREGGIAPGLELKNVLPRLTDEAVAVIRKHAPRSSAQPLLLYFAPTGPHTPWLPAEEYRGRSAAGLYGDFTMMVDAMIGRLLAALEEAHMAEDTLVIFTSDNGPTWYPEDVARTGHDSAAGLRGMKGTHFEGGHRMPLVVRWPGRVRPGTVSRQLMGFTDVVATVAATVPAPLPDGAAADSLNFLPVLLGTQPEDRPIRETLVVGQSLRRGNWKWIEGREPVAFGKPELGTVPTQGKAPGMLFDLANDPAEKLDLASQRADLAEELRTELQRIRSTTQTRR